MSFHRKELRIKRKNSNRENPCEIRKEKIEEERIERS